MRRIQNRLAKALAAIIPAGTAVTWAVGQVRNEQVAQRDVRMVSRMTNKTTTVCMGRFLVDMPEEARIELARARIDGFDIASFDEPEADFKVRPGQREARLRSTPDQFGGTRNLELVREVKTENGVVGKIFVHGRIVKEGTQARGLELERYRHEGVAVEALVHGQGKPDKQSLLERHANTEAGSSDSEKGSIFHLRAAPRTIGGVAGDELVTRFAENNDAIVYSFAWEVDPAQQKRSSQVKAPQAPILSTANPH